MKLSATIFNATIVLFQSLITPQIHATVKKGKKLNRKSAVRENKVRNNFFLKFTRAFRLHLLDDLSTDNLLSVYEDCFYLNHCHHTHL